MSEYSAPPVTNIEFKQRVTIPITPPGCTVNCAYCTVASKLTEVNNRGKLYYSLAFPTGERNPFYTIYELVAYINRPNRGQIDTIANWIGAMVEQGLTVGADIGIITSPSYLATLKNSGLAYLQTNLETNEDCFFDRIQVPTTRYMNKIATIQAASQAGIPTSSGMLLGLGETESEIAMLLAELTKLPVFQVVFNCLNRTDSRISERYPSQIKKEYILQTLQQARQSLRPDQKICLGNGGEFFFSGDMGRLKGLVDVIHTGQYLQ